MICDSRNDGVYGCLLPVVVPNNAINDDGWRVGCISSIKSHLFLSTGNKVIYTVYVCVIWVCIRVVTMPFFATDCTSGFTTTSCGVASDDKVQHDNPVFNAYIVWCFVQLPLFVDSKYTVTLSTTGKPSALHDDVSLSSPSNRSIGSLFPNVTSGGSDWKEIIMTSIALCDNRRIQFLSRHKTHSGKCYHTWILWCHTQYLGMDE